jgi:multiple sugar transport system substrate-binding protein
MNIGKEKIQIVIVLSALFLLIASILFGAFFMTKQVGKEGGSTQQVFEANEQLVTIDYYTWGDEAFYINAIVEEFNQLHHNIKVNVHLLDTDEYENEILDKLKTDEKIDVIGARGISKMVQYKEKGYLYDITEKIQNSNIDVTAYGNMYNNVSINGRYYGLPTRSTCWVLVYNKEIFDRLNLPYPTKMTWEEYRDLAQRITEESNGEFWGGYWIDWIYNFMGIQQSNYLYDDDLQYTKDSLEFLYKLMYEDKSHMTFEEIRFREQDWLNNFEEGTIAMMPQGEWFVGMIIENETQGESSIDWDLAPMPIPEGQEDNTTWGQYQFAGIANRCINKEEAFIFLKYLCGKEGAETLAKYGMLSAYTNESIQDLYRLKTGSKNIVVFFDAKRVQEQPVYGAYSDLTEKFLELSDRYFEKEVSVDDVFDQFIIEREKIIKNYN